MPFGYAVLVAGSLDGVGNLLFLPSRHRGRDGAGSDRCGCLETAIEWQPG